MIINLVGTCRDSIITFEPCPIYFEKNQFVHVNELAIEWKNQVSNIHGMISSSLVDLSPVNMNQQLLYFHQDHKSNLMYYSPTHFAKYKIQCPSLQASVFNITLSEKHEIEKIYLQLEITNAGI